MDESFSVIRRNPGHWDIYTQTGNRIFCIRGSKGHYYIREREGEIHETVEECMRVICKELMKENNHEDF